MTGNVPADAGAGALQAPWHDPVPDAQQQRRDEQLLDALRTGTARAADRPGAGPNGDRLADELAAWCDDVGADLPGFTLRPATLGQPAAAPEGAGADARGRRWWRRMASAGLGLAVAVGGGVAATAGGADPGDPLWPVTALVYPERAQSRMAQQDAEELLATARTEVARGDYHQAGELLDEADPLVEEVTDPAAQHRLTQELSEVREVIAPEAVDLMPTDLPVPVPTDLPVPLPTGPPDLPLPPPAEPGNTPTTAPTVAPTGPTTGAPDPSPDPSADGPPLRLPPLPSLLP